MKTGLLMLTRTMCPMWPRLCEHLMDTGFVPLVIHLIIKHALLEAQIQNMLVCQDMTSVC